MQNCWAARLCDFLGLRKEGTNFYGGLSHFNLQPLTKLQTVTSIQKFSLVYRYRSPYELSFASYTWISIGDTKAAIFQIGGFSVTVDA
jgi:hypothetical protein